LPFALSATTATLAAGRGLKENAAMNPAELPTARDVVGFWRQAGPERWFAKNEAFDAQFRERFLAAHEAAARGELDHWAQGAEGALALLVLLDQFPRNTWRGNARMLATDAKALAIARQAIEAGLDLKTDEELRRFFYLPFMHSESLDDQQRSVELNAALDANTQRFAVQHRAILARFGRFPHRNKLLGRTSTAEEQRFLDEGGFAG
jgi:uncharacterized protein (DUF924 family)